MKAVTVEPNKAGSARLEDVSEPDPNDGSLLVEAIAVGVCGTDTEIVEAKYGWAPPGKARFVLGHESLGRIIETSSTGTFQKGDLVVGIVRRPDPVPCSNCAVGEWDMCRNGQYTERGIKAIDGFMSERWRIEPEYAMKVDRSLGLLGVLLEPTTVVAKAWELVVAVGQRAFWEPRTVLITGAGPIGLLAALLAIQRGLEVHVLDRIGSGPKPDLVRALGATYHTGAVSRVGFEPDVIIECTGVGEVVSDSIQSVGSGGIVCLTGVGSGGSIAGPATGEVAAQVVLRNNVIVGSVNANKRHWYKAGAALARADRSWLAQLVPRREQPENFLAGALGGVVGAIATEMQRAHGVDLRLGVSVVALEGDAKGHVRRVRLSDGTTLDVDVVLASLGSLRNIEWLEGAGLAAGFWGVACDAGCRAFDVHGVVTDNIFVAGDIARSPHVLYEYEFLAMEHWDNAVLGAEIAGNNMVSDETKRRPHLLVPAFWSGQFGINIKSVGVPSFGDEIVITQGSIKERRFAAAYGRRGRIVGAVTFDHAKWLDYYRVQIEQSGPFPPAPVGYDRPADTNPMPADFPARGVPTAIPDVVLTGHDPLERQAEYRSRSR